MIFAQLDRRFSRLFCINLMKSDSDLSATKKTFMTTQTLQKSKFFIPFILLLLVVLASCDDDGITSVTFEDIGPFDTSNAERIETDEGLVIYEHKQGDGHQIVEEVHTVRIRYTGRTTDGDIFDSTYRNDLDSPRDMTVQRSGMVRGFFQGIVGIVDEDGQRHHYAREGSQRTLIIPPELAYGGSSHSLNQDTLIFDIEILAITNRD